MACWSGIRNIIITLSLPIITVPWCGVRPPNTTFWCSTSRIIGRGRCTVNRCCRRVLSSSLRLIPTGISAGRPLRILTAIGWCLRYETGRHSHKCQQIFSFAKAVGGEGKSLANRLHGQRLRHKVILTSQDKVNVMKTLSRVLLMPL